MDSFEFLLGLILIAIYTYFLVVIVLEQFEETTFRLNIVAKRQGEPRHRALAPRVQY